MTINNKPHRAIAVLSLPAKVEDLINLVLKKQEGPTAAAPKAPGGASA